MTEMRFRGPWTQEKLGILRRYLDAYTTALKDTRFNLTYVDAFAGSGTWRSEIGYMPDDYDDFQDVHLGSAGLALEVDDKPFDYLLFIEKDPARSLELDRMRLEHPQRNIEIRNGDANEELPLFCRNMGTYTGRLCFLTPSQPKFGGAQWR